MARLARAVFAGHPHHVTQRGNGGAQTFFSDEDYATYRDLLIAHCRAANVEVWAWVFMPNHVHLVLVPSDCDGLRRALAAVHRRYAGYVHARLRRTGHFWQGRFGCAAMDEGHLAAAMRYVVLNPVRAQLVDDARAWRWSSVHAQLGAEEDGLTTTAPTRARFGDLAAMIGSPQDQSRRDQSGWDKLRRAETIGRPVGTGDFVADLEAASGRRLAPAKRGPQIRAKRHEAQAVPAPAALSQANVEYA